MGCTNSIEMGHNLANKPKSPKKRVRKNSTSHRNLITNEFTKHVYDVYEPGEIIGEGMR